MRPITLYKDVCPHCKGKHTITALEEIPPEYFEQLKKEVLSLLEDVYNGKAPDNSLLALTGQTLTDRVSQSFNEITVDFTTPDAEMLARLTRDVWQFSAAKNWQQMRDLTLALKDENGKLREWDSFKDEAGKICDRYNETWLRTEYDLAISSSQSAARWVEYEKEADIIPFLEYQTVGDSEVRPEHAVLDGIVKAIHDVFWTTHYPPNGYGCRCEAIQAIDGEKRETPEKDIPKVHIPDIFRTNLAKTGLIFPKNHPYYNGIPKSELRKAIAYLPPENTFLDVAIGTNEIEIHPLHGDEELSKNIETCNILLKHDEKAKLKLLPIINEHDIEIKDKFYSKEYVKNFKNKNADALYNEKIVEFEEPTCKGNSIKNTLRKAKEQADIIIMRVPDDVDFDKIYNEINGQMNHYNNDPKYEKLEVWIVNNNELRKYEKQTRK